MMATIGGRMPGSRMMATIGAGCILLLLGWYWLAGAPRCPPAVRWLLGWRSPAEVRWRCGGCAPALGAVGLFWSLRRAPWCPG